MEVEAIGAEMEIHRVLAEYCHLCDDGKFESVVTLFTADGTFDFAGSRAHGAEELLRWFEDTHPPARRGKHLTLNTVIDLDGDRAHVISDFVFLVVRGDVTSPLTSGRYLDEFRRADGQWLIEERVVRLMRPPPVGA